MSKNILVLIVSVFFLNSCVSRAVVKEGYNFNSINKIAVLKFSGPGMSGVALKDEFVRQLLAKGIDVVDFEPSTDDPARTAHRLGAQIFVTGTVSNYKPGQNFYIYKEKNSQNGAVVYTNPIIELESDRVYKRQNVLDDESILLYTNTSISVNSRMIDVTTGEVVWADSFDYEGLDSASSIDYTVMYFLSSIARHWDKLNIKKNK